MSEEYSGGRGTTVHDTPVANLITGLLYKNNWQYLNREDMLRWMRSYGATGKKENEEQNDVFIEVAIRQQNAMLRELTDNDFGTDSGEGIVLALIQAQYDPDAPTRKEEEDKKLWKASWGDRSVLPLQSGFADLTSKPTASSNIPTSSSVKVSSNIPPLAYSSFAQGLTPSQPVFHAISNTESIIPI